MVSLTILQWLTPVKTITLKDVKLKGGEYGYDQMNYLTIGSLAYATTK